MKETQDKEFKELYKKHKVGFMRYAHSLLQDQGKAEDAVHEAFLSVYSHWENFRGNSNRSTWLWAILRNACLKHFRRAEFRYETHVENEEIESTPTEASQETKLIEKSDAHLVEQAMAELSPKQREILELRMSDLSLEEISEILKIPVATVKSHIHRSKKSLLQKLSGGLP